MAEDTEVLRELWDSRVVVSFMLADEEVFSATGPDQLFMLLPRQSYLPLVTEKVQKHFLKFVDPDHLGEMWFDDDGVPVRWHYPLGVLIDLAGVAVKQPWTLTVHFRNFPEKELLHCSSRDAVEAHFMSSVKEADCLKHRSHVINKMQEKDHKQLFLSLASSKFDQFWAVNRKLMEHTGGELFRHIPFRIHQQDRHFVTKLFQPIDEDHRGRMNTLLDLLCSVVPGFSLDTGEVNKKYRVLIQGIEPPLDTSVQWLSEHLSYPDNFLHICISAQ